MEKLTVRDPSTGAVLAEIDRTPIESLPETFARARAAQAKWGVLRLKDRARALYDLREVVISRMDELADLIHRENGKTKVEALTMELAGSIELLTYFARRAPELLAEKEVRIGNPILWHRRSTLNYWPLGVVAVIAPWNFPFLLPFGDIALAAAAGNAVVFKPSEFTPLVGLKIQELFEEAGFPVGLVQTVVGDGALGSALIDRKPGKIFFTGSVPTGKKIMEQASRHLIPVVLELGGKDPMVVLPDANLDLATSAALWGSFSNAGQMCASTERLIVHESIAEPFVKLLNEKIQKLRVGSADADIGAITVEKQKDVYRAHLDEARAQGLRVQGGEWVEASRFMRPAVVTGASAELESSRVYTEETFGPVVAVTTFRSMDEAVRKANQSPYGLLGSVITRNLKLGDKIARQMEAGTVTINEVAFTAGVPETPWGGLKDSGFGRKHSDAGIYEFVNVRHVNRPRSSLFSMKSPWWYPYSPFQYETFRSYLKLYRRSFWRKLSGLPNFLWNLVHFLKNERRL